MPRSPVKQKYTIAKLEQAYRSLLTRAVILLREFGEMVAIHQAACTQVSRKCKMNEKMAI